VSEPVPPAAPAPLSSRARWASYALVLVLAALLALWGGFLVPLRYGTTPVPVSWLIAVVGNGALGWVGGRLLGRRGAIGPGLVWLVVALMLGTQRAEGDLIVPGTVVGLVFLLSGAVTSAVAYGAVPRSRA
jgi:fatty acid desaturase